MQGRFNKGLCLQVFAGSAASLGAFAAATLFGWITPILPHLLGPDSEIPMSPQEASWMISAPEIANMITPIPSGLLIDHYGRKPLLLLSAPMFTLGWGIILYWKTYLSLLVARTIQGAAVGIVFTAVPVYLGEISSVKYRGAITSLFFLFSWSGYLFEYCTGPFLSFTNFTYLTMSTTIVYFLLMSFQPESPYFCLMKGYEKAAYISLKWFRNGSEEMIHRELEEMKQSVKEDKMKKTNWGEVVATPTDRKALYLMLFSGSLRILCGIMPTTSYATRNFMTTPDIAIAPKYITMILGVVLVLGAGVSFFTIDILGRRTLIISSSVGASICLFIAGMYYYLDSNTTLAVSRFSWVAPLATLIYAGIVVAGMCPVHTAYTSELFNSNTRANASSIAAVLSTFFTLVTLKSYQNFIDMFGVYFNYILFSLICFIGAVISYFLMPETKNKSFKQIRDELIHKN